MNSDSRVLRDYWVAPLLFFILFVVYYISAQPLMDDSDVPWHLATGRLLLETGHVPLKDPWSFAAQEQPWYLLSWVWDLMLGVTEAVFGTFGVLILILMISASLVAMLAAHLVHIRISLSAIFFTCMIAGLCILDFITARPHLGGYALVFIFYVVLHHSRPYAGEKMDSGLRRYDGKWMWVLVPLMLLWANMHGSFIAGFTVIGAFVVEAFFTRQFGWMKKLIIVGLACGMAALINPYGLEVTIGALKTLNGTARGYTIEWLPFTFSASTGVSTWLLLFIAVSNLRFSRMPIADKLLAFAWLVASMFIIRNAAIFVLLSAPYLARCMDEATMDLREVRAPSVFASFMERQRLSVLWAVSVVCVLAFATVASRMPHEDKILSESASVMDAVDYAQEHYGTHKFLCNFNFGGQLIYRTYGKLPFMMDARAGTVYSEEVIKDYIAFMELKPEWPALLKKYGVNGIIMYNNGTFAQAYENGQFHDRWKLVFAGKKANVYIARP